METVPGVLSVTMSTFPVLSRTMNHRPFWVQGAPLPRQDEWPMVNAIDARFFDTFEIPVALGRAFNPRDGEGAPRTRDAKDEDAVADRAGQDGGQAEADPVESVDLRPKIERRLCLVIPTRGSCKTGTPTIHLKRR